MIAGLDGIRIDHVAGSNYSLGYHGPQIHEFQKKWDNEPDNFRFVVNDNLGTAWTILKMEQSYTGVEKVGFLEMEANVMTDPVVEDTVLDRIKAQGRKSLSVNGDDIYEYKFVRMFDE